MDFKVNMSDLMGNRLNLVDSNQKMNKLVQNLTHIVNALFQVNIMSYGYHIEIIGEKEWIDNVFNKKIKQSFKNTEGSECIASLKVIRGITNIEYDIAISVKKDCQPTNCSWYEVNIRQRGLYNLGTNLRETLNTFNLPEELFTIKLGGGPSGYDY
jgi:hypothetical protein